jgi:hypothetical protein
MGFDGSLCPSPSRTPPRKSIVQFGGEKPWCPVGYQSCLAWQERRSELSSRSKLAEFDGDSTAPMVITNAGERRRADSRRLVASTSRSSFNTRRQSVTTREAVVRCLCARRMSSVLPLTVAVRWGLARADRRRATETADWTSAMKIRAVVCCITHRRHDSGIPFFLPDD